MSGVRRQERAAVVARTYKRRRGWPVVMAAAVCAAAGAFAQEAATGPATNTYVLLPHEDSRFAADLLRLNQPDLIAAEEAAAKGTPAENLWKAERIVAQWTELSKNRLEAQQHSAEYVAAVTVYLDSQTSGIDGVWALDQAKFIFSRLAEPIINRMEYWANTPKDREELAPLAALADRLMKQANVSLAAGMRDAEKGAFDEAEYMRFYNGAGEAEYYGAWGAYYQAMAMEPGAAGRKALLEAAAKTLGKWADAKEDTGVNNQSLLLRGKARAEAGDLEKAAADLKKAQNGQAPTWVQYQARYQRVVVDLRRQDFAAARQDLAALTSWLPANNAEARASTEMLAYRVGWAEAQTKTGEARSKAEQEALGILGGIVRRDPRYRDSVFQQLANQVPDDAHVDALHPLQQVAVAYAESLGQKGDSPESKRKLQMAAEAAAAVYNNATATPAEKLEGAFLAGVCHALLGNLAEAARYNVAFAELATPSDPRTKPIVELAIQQIAELRKAAGEAGPSPELKDLSERALTLSTGKLGETQFKYAQARTLEDNGKPDKAATAFAQVPAEDKNYLDARFHLIILQAERLSSGKLPEEVAKSVGKELFAACADFLKMTDTPPAGAPADAVARAKRVVPDIWLIEAGAALQPAIKDPATALDLLQKLEGRKDELSAAQEGAVLRYKVQAYQMAGQPDKAFEAVQAYAKGQGQDALDVIKGMAVSSLEDINKVEKTDPAQARRLADYVAKLLEPIIAESAKQGKKDTVYEYQQIRADMLVRSGHAKEGREVALKLQQEKPGDLRSFMTEARACFAIAQQTKSPQDYAYAKDYFERIQPRITPGVDSYWECWLRMMQCAEAINGEAAAPEIRKKLGDLQVLFGSKLGGEAFKADFEAMLKKYPPAGADGEK
jgi:hypothetical protein